MTIDEIVSSFPGITNSSVTRVESVSIEIQKKELDSGCKVFPKGLETNPKDRKAQALKANLAKRKQQQRARGSYNLQKQEFV